MSEIVTIARDIYRLQVQHIEEFAAAYFQKTHLDPQEAKLVLRQTLTDTGVKLEYWFEPFPSESEIEIYRKRADLAEAATSLALVENSKTIKQLNEAERELAALKERTRWIHINDRQPTRNAIYPVLRRHGVTGQLYRDEEVWNSHKHCWEDDALYKVIFWFDLQLPEPPEAAHA